MLLTQVPVPSEWCLKCLRYPTTGVDNTVRGEPLVALYSYLQIMHSYDRTVPKLHSPARGRCELHTWDGRCSLTLVRVKITVQWDQDSWVGRFAKKYVVWLEFYEFLTREAKFWRFWKLTKWAFYKYCHFWKDSLYVLSYHWVKAQLGEKLRKHPVKFPTYFRLPANDDASINLYSSMNIYL